MNEESVYKNLAIRLLLEGIKPDIWNALFDMAEIFNLNLVWDELNKSVEEQNGTISLRKDHDLVLDDWLDE